METSPGKNIFFPSIPAASTISTPTEISILDFAVMCLLIRSHSLSMRFVFLSTEFCSPASFRCNLTVTTLAAY